MKDLLNIHVSIFLACTGQRNRGEEQEEIKQKDCKIQTKMFNLQFFFLATKQKKKGELISSAKTQLIGGFQSLEIKYSKP